MRVIFLLCATFALSISTADPVKEMKPEPVEEPVPVQQNKTGEEKRGEPLPRGAGRMAKWQYGGINRFPDYYSGEDDCPTSWQRYGSRCFVFINSPMAWVDAEKHCWPYGANLASVHDQWEYSFIQDSVIDQGYYGQAWIGGTDAVRPMDSLWSDGSVSDVGSWATSTWDRHKKCFAIRRPDLSPLKWYCEDMLPFVCGTRPETFEKVEAVPEVGKQEESKMPDDDKQSWHSCPASWSKYGSRCFTIIPREMPWIDAEEYCLSYSANLASIHNPGEYGFIQEMIRGNTSLNLRAWIGGTNAVKDQTWLWSDGSGFHFQNWGIGEPNNVGGQEKCLEMIEDYRWNDLPCESNLAFVCGTRP